MSNFTWTVEDIDVILSFNTNNHFDRNNGKVQFKNKISPVVMKNKK